MAVLSVVIPASQEAHLAIELLQHGLEHTAEVIDRGDNRVWVDIVGNPEKALRASLRAGAKPIAFVPNVRVKR